MNKKIICLALALSALIVGSYTLISKANERKFSSIQVIDEIHRTSKIIESRTY